MMHPLIGLMFPSLSGGVDIPYGACYQTPRQEVSEEMKSINRKLDAARERDDRARQNSAWAKQFKKFLKRKQTKSMLTVSQAIALFEEGKMTVSAKLIEELRRHPGDHLLGLVENDNLPPTLAVIPPTPENVAVLKRQDAVLENLEPWCPAAGLQRGKIEISPSALQ